MIVVLCLEKIEIIEKVLKDLKPEENGNTQQD